MNVRFDAVIIGGGPAGAMSALRLTRLGWRVAVIERGVRNRQKTCGHCLNLRAMGILQREDLLDDVRRTACGFTRTLRVHLPRRKVCEWPLVEHATQASGLVIDRRTFDQLLLDRAASAGALLVQPANARVAFENGESIVDFATDNQLTRLQTHLVIGADGVGSAVARAMNANRVNAVHAGRKYGFSFDVFALHSGEMQSGAIEMLIAPNGYLGIVRSSDSRVHVAGLVSINPNDERARDPFSFCRSMAALHKELSIIGLENLEQRDVMNMAAIGPMPWRPLCVADASTALVGDAAGYVEPFTGEGMSWAIHSADVLASCLQHEPVGTWNSAVALRYARAWKKAIARSQRACRSLSYILARPRLTWPVFQAGNRIAFLRRRVLQKVAAS